MTISDRTRRLFMRALRSVARQRNALPANVSIINDRIRADHPKWRVLDETGGTFAMLCAFFEREGLLRMGKKGDSRTLT
jgi:hypothetical protein